MKYLLVLLLIILGQGIHAQKKNILLINIRGTVTGEEQENPLAGATVTLYAQDSSITKSTFSDKTGAFKLDKIAPGEYQLYISYLGYKIEHRKVAITEKDTLVDLGTVMMKGSGITLATVEIVNETPPMVIKKDTIEFNASSFKTRDYAVVEDLLKRLPGVDVERDGIIRINGIVVSKLLVDGKSFFGDDPTMATQNLTADMIDKVQFIDRRSEWSQFTGINDGRREKTINITIRKDKKNSYFGRVGGALATGDHFAVNGSLNKFNDQQQLAFSIGSTDINGYQDKGGQGIVSAGGSSNVRNWKGSGTCNRDLSEKLKIGGSYSTSNNYTEEKRSSERQILLPDTTAYYNRSSHSQVTDINHVLSMHMELMPDTSHMLNVSARFTYANGNSFQQNLYSSLGEERQLINSGITSNTSTIKAPDFSATALYGKKFKKVGRTLAINLGIGYVTNDLQSINRSHNLYVTPVGYTFADTVNQKNKINRTGRSMTLSLTYTESLFKEHYLELTYLYSHDYGASDRFTYDFNPYRKEYDQMIDSLSNSFRNSSSIQQLGVKLLAQKKKLSYIIGLNTQFTNLYNDNISQGIRTQQHIPNFFPSAGFNYYFNSGKQLQFSFSGNTRRPSVSQLQPTPDNSNPLYIEIGNPDLKPSFISAFKVGYSVSDPITTRMFSTVISSEIYTNKIVDASWLDSLGRQVSQPLNINGSFTVSASISANFPIKKQRNSINTNISFGFNRDMGYINGVKGDTRIFNIAPNFSYYFTHKELLDVGINLNANYNVVKYIMQQKKANFLNCTVSFDGNIRLPLDFIIGGNMVYLLNTYSIKGSNRQSAMLNMFVSRTLFKRRQGMVRLQGVDLLNGNVGISRTVEVNYVEDLQTTVMQRLFLMSFTYFVRGLKGKVHP